MKEGRKKQEEVRRNLKKPEATVMHDNFLKNAILEGNNIEIKYRQEEMEYLYSLFY